ncbi:MAG: hypothetical protein U0936_04150 [Planctomycetaceae bacterium]
MEFVLRSHFEWQGNAALGISGIVTPALFLKVVNQRTDERPLAFMAWLRFDLCIDLRNTGRRVDCAMKRKRMGQENGRPSVDP